MKPHRTALRCLLATATLAGALLGSATAQPLSVLINPGDVGEQSRTARYQVLA
jgi:hypothetical protein